MSRDEGIEREILQVRDAAGSKTWRKLRKIKEYLKLLFFVTKR